MTEANILRPVVVEVDIAVTRRQKIHAVVDGDGDQLFHSRRITEVFMFLMEHDVTTFELLDEDHHFHVNLSFPLTLPQAPKGVNHG